MFSDEHLYAIALRRCRFIGDVTFNKLVEAHGGTENVWKLPKRELDTLFGIGHRVVREIGSKAHLEFAENELEFCSRNGISVRLRHAEDYPSLLGECADAPAVLYQKGTYHSDKTPVSIVGTRSMTSYGEQFVDDFLSELGKAKVQTVSGLALGVDTRVHCRSVEVGVSTVAVLAHGFHTIYPAKNRLLSEEILSNGGALFTEFNSSHRPDREHFIQRNRVIAGLSKATIVCETAFGGGSVSTANFANQYDRDVYALPGRITDKYSQGCNLLIASHKAAAISTVGDLVKNLGLSFYGEGRTAELFPVEEQQPVMTPEQTEVYAVIKSQPMIGLDEIAERTSRPAHALLSILLEMEISGYIRSFSGRQYRAL